MMKKRSGLADEIIFNYKYEAPTVSDSVLQVINESSNLKDWNMMIQAEFEKARANYLIANNLLDSCIAQTESEYLTIKAHVNQAKVYTVQNNLSSALDHFELALELSQNTEYVIIRAEIYATMGEFYRKHKILMSLLNIWIVLRLS